MMGLEQLIPPITLPVAIHLLHSLRSDVLKAEDLMTDVKFKVDDIIDVETVNLELKRVRIGLGWAK